MYVGTGNPTPVLNGPARPGDNKWTGSILAINPDTGKLAWGFQAVPHDTHDWDAAEVPVLVDATFNGTPRKLLLQASRNGYYFVLDRTNGKNLLTMPFAAVNWAKRHRQGWQPDTRPCQGTGARRPPGGARRGWRHQLSVAELRSRPPGCSSSPRVTRTGSGSTRKSTATTDGRAPITASAAGLHPRPRLPDRQGALGPPDRRRIGRGRPHDRPPASPSPATGAATRWRCARATASTLWHAAIGGVGNSPVTIEIDGRQHLLIGGGSGLYAWRLPVK